MSPPDDVSRSIEISFKWENDHGCDHREAKHEACQHEDREGQERQGSASEEDGEGYPVILAARYDDLGLMLEAAQRPKEAAEAFRNSFKLFESQVAEFPEEANANHDMAYRSSSCPAAQFRNPGRAVEFAKKTLQVNSTRAEYWRTLALAEYRVGNWQAAGEAARKARQLQPTADDWDLFVLAWPNGD